MKIRRLRLTNYRRHRDTQIEFPDGVTAIIGRNGSGKTSVLEAIAFAFYGTQATRTNKDLLRHDRAPKGDPLRIELDAEVAGQAIAITRELRGANQTGYATLTVDGQTIVPAQAGSMEAVTQEIIARIGLDRETFFSTVFTPQKDLARLAERSRNDRKKLILGMLGIDAVDDAIAEGRTRRRAAQARLEALQGTLPDTDALQQAIDDAHAQHAAADQAMADATKAWDAAKQRLEAANTAHQSALQADAGRREADASRKAAEQTLQHARERLASTQEQLEAAQQAETEAKPLAAAAADLDAASAAVEKAINDQHVRERRTELLDEQAMLEQRLKDHVVPNLEDTIVDEAAQAVAQAKHVLQTVQQEAADLQARTSHTQQRIEAIDELGEDADCPVCERPMAGHASTMLQHLHEELDESQVALHAAKAKVAQAEQAVHAAETTLQRVDRRKAARDEAARDRRRIEDALRACQQHLAAAPDPGPALDMQALRQRLAKAQDAQARHARAAAMAEALPRLAGEMEQRRDDVAKASEAVDGWRAKLAAMPDTQADVLQAEQAMRGAELAERQGERDVADVRLKQEAAKAALAAAEARMAEAKQRAAQLEDARIDHQHWQFLAGDRGTGLLDRFRSHLVARIGPAIQTEASRLIAAFTAGRYTEILLDDQYDIYVTDNGVAYTIDRFSGGEADLVHLALRLAISRLLLERAGGAEIRFLALDEVFGSLDGERRGLVLQALQSLGTLYSQVLVVTHHEGLQEGLDHVLAIHDDDGEAVASMHNG